MVWDGRAYNVETWEDEQIGDGNEGVDRSRRVVPCVYLMTVVSTVKRMRLTVVVVVVITVVMPMIGWGDKSEEMDECSVEKSLIRVCLVIILCLCISNE